MRSINLIIYLLTLLSVSAVPVVEAQQLSVQDKTAAYAGKAGAVRQWSKQKLYRVSLYSREAPIPLKRIHQWIVRVETADGKPVADAKIGVFGGMPMHQHGFPTKPRVTDYLGEGEYRVEGIKFSMPGYWQMRFNIRSGKQRDRVVFEINLDY